MKTFTCHMCHLTKDCQTSGGTGYATLEGGEVICYACCAVVDKARMIERRRATLYLTHETVSFPDQWARLTSVNYASGAGFRVTNWPGTLSFPVRYVKRGRHNLARWRYDFRFTGPDDKVWSGTVYGDNTQIARCRRLKSCAT